MSWPDGETDYDISPPLPLDADDPMSARHLTVTGRPCSAGQREALDGGTTWGRTSHSLLCTTVRGDTEVSLSFRAFSTDEAEVVVASLQRVEP
jgi:hypothetical protein